MKRKMGHNSKRKLGVITYLMNSFIGLYFPRNVPRRKMGIILSNTWGNDFNCWISNWQGHAFFLKNKDANFPCVCFNSLCRGFPSSLGCPPWRTYTNRDMSRKHVKFVCVCYDDMTIYMHIYKNNLRLIVQS